MSFLSEWIKWNQNEAVSRKLRLLGLRKVLTNHTSKERLQYILNKIKINKTLELKKYVYCISRVETQEEINYVIDTFNKFSYTYKKLILLIPDDMDLIKFEDTRIRTITEKYGKSVTISNFGKCDWVALISSKDHYGSEYLTDIMLATKFSNAMAIGKACYYSTDGMTYDLINDGLRYSYVNILDYRSSCVVSSIISNNSIFELGRLIDFGTFTGISCLSIDEFNYARNCTMKQVPFVDDLSISNQGLSFDYLNSHICKLHNIDQSNTYFQNGSNLIKNSTKFSTRISIASQQQQSTLKSTLQSDKHEYVYLKEKLSIEHIPIKGNFHCYFSATNGLDVRLVLIIYSSNDEKLLSKFILPNRRFEFLMPEGAKSFTLGLRIQGSGECTIDGVFITSPLIKVNSYIPTRDSVVIFDGDDEFDDYLEKGSHPIQTISNSEVIILGAHKTIRFSRRNGFNVSYFSTENLLDVLKSGFYKSVIVSERIDNKIENPIEMSNNTIIMLSKKIKELDYTKLSSVLLNDEE